MRRNPAEDAPPADVIARFERFPEGTFAARVGATRWVLTKNLYAGGASGKLVGHALDGSSAISFNLYRTGSGLRLRPCEMPVARVIALVRAFEVSS